jgi:hypothetical protein
MTFNRYPSTEVRSMKRLGTHFTVLASLLLLAALIAGCGSGNREGTIGPDVALTGTVQKGDPALAAAAGYIGSEACKNCHPTQFTGWSKSLHNAPLKTVAELGAGIFVNDANSNGINDFQDGLDLATTSAFASFLDNAPKLSSANGKFFATIGPVTYEIQRTQGGNGLWKQRYQTKVGKSYYILPFQYNEKTRQYVTYSDNNWYNRPQTSPRFTAPYGSDNLVVQLGLLNKDSDKKGTAVSWENRCSGCHQTGLTLASQTQAYAGDNVTEVVSGYVELNIGCEACHGPGAQHVNSSGNPAFITNPANLERLGVGGIRLADQVCGNCHQRGEEAKLAGMSLNASSRPVSAGLPVAAPGKLDRQFGGNLSSSQHGRRTTADSVGVQGERPGTSFPTTGTGTSAITSRSTSPPCSTTRRGPTWSRGRTGPTRPPIPPASDATTRTRGRGTTRSRTRSPGTA